MSRYLNVSKENGLHPTAKAVGIRPNEFITAALAGCITKAQPASVVVGDENEEGQIDLVAGAVKTIGTTTIKVGEPTSCEGLTYEECLAKAKNS